MSRRLTEFYASNPEHRPFMPVEDIARGRERFAQEFGGGGPPLLREDYHNIEVNPRIGQQISQTYQRLPGVDPRAESSFEAMRVETGKQFDFLTGSRSKGGLGIDVQVNREDPYRNPGEMVSDLREGRLKVLGSEQTGEHPYFSPDENNMFRAVHDAFGHGGAGRGFDRHGEEAAWLSHSRMYTPQARPAMTTETRGQNSAFIFAGQGREFPEQKVATLPSQFSDPLRTPIGRRASFRSGQSFSSF